MSNEIVKYGNELNTIPLRNFTAVEQNLLVTIISRIRDCDDEIVRLYFDDLKSLSNYKATANKSFIDDITSTYDKLLSLRFGSRSSSGLSVERFVLFSRFKIVGDTDIPYVDLQVFELAIPILNELKNEFTRFGLTPFIALSSSYSKTMFRLLKQFRTTGYVYFPKKDFFELLDIPKSYWNSPSNIDKFILKPIKEELAPLFRGLTIRKKYGKERGKPVIGYQFSFKPEAKNADDFSKGLQEDLREKLFNIEHNGELSQEEKWVAKDKVLGLKLGTHKQDFYRQQKKEEEKMLEDEWKNDLINQLNKKIN